MTEAGTALRAVGGAHAKLVHARRVRALAAAIAPLLDPTWRVADVGCGDGQLASLLMQAVPGLQVEGFELAARPTTAIPVHVFDGSKLPVADNSFDAVLFVDVLHHTPDPAILLAEAARVASKAVVIKDHRMSRPFAGITLRFMDWVGNRPHGVVLPYNYWPENRWRQTWSKLGLHVDTFETKLGLYPWPASWAFECGLHFVTRLTPKKS